MREACYSSGMQATPVKFTAAQIRARIFRVEFIEPFDIYRCWYRDENNLVQYFDSPTRPLEVR